METIKTYASLAWEWTKEKANWLREQTSETQVIVIGIVGLILAIWTVDFLAPLIFGSGPSIAYLALGPIGLINLAWGVFAAFLLLRIMFPTMREWVEQGQFSLLFADLYKTLRKVLSHTAMHYTDGQKFAEDWNAMSSEARMSMLVRAGWLALGVLSLVSFILIAILFAFVSAINVIN